MDSANLGKLLIAAGALLVFAGLFFLFKDRVPGLDRLGKLPGDIRYESENVKFYFPVVTSLLLSLLLSLLFWHFRSRQ